MLLTHYLQTWGLPYGWAWAISQALVLGILEFLMLLMVAAVILLDRKIWAAVSLRRGPNVVGAFGVLQTIADALKFLFKEVVIPAGANKVIFILAPLVTATLAYAGWAVVPLDDGWVAADINVGILYLFAMSSLGVYGIIMAGWASNSKYPFLSALRAAAQMVSYEVSIGFVIITVLLFAGSLNLSAIVRAQETHGIFAFTGWNVFSILFPMLPIFFVSALAETKRPPFDLVEAESELVAGFFVEYSATPFLLFFLGEYISVLLMCALCSVLFFGGWLPPLNVAPFTLVPGVIWLALKMLFVFFLFAVVKTIVPRYRYDQLMRLGWKVFLPTSLLWVVVTAGYVLVFHHHG
ncbi:MAG TPA: NADH-quinone oxidoreductase subunit NuoH [Rhizomicrobium sp.]|nr:NADH-quinone oxidoreductase subunit NuoH [Rhizomicrobium sp.]